MISTIIFSIAFAIASFVFIVSGEKSLAFSSMSVSVLLVILSRLEEILKTIREK